ncbi:FecR family protein [Hymenobacter roseosalivarius DSM 11622]|uniref:FecR family protein n=1 Tax=Hymenobacter roseosalivarius DSM 11622 TaxID=645990 RepID=A0A1W1W0Z5_9BACT|nr:FecR family protein [Hymenobacter roseosalivarius]SMB99160.1 FecR family protein [Hymenobacter roseosalivarius DSM 11622]
MKSENQEAVLQRYLRGESPPDEAKRVEQWYEALAASQTELSLADNARLKAKLWNRIETVIQAPTSAHEVFPMWRLNPLRWAVAALLVLGLGFGVLLLQPQRAPVTAARLAVPHTTPSLSANQWITHTNVTSQVVRLALADGSTVRLQPRSTLRYPQQFTNAKREVFLQGEAFFEIARNPVKPFLVVTDKVVTTVLGTSFTVRAYPEQPQALVMVRTGRVRVSPRPSGAGSAAGRMAAPLELMPNQQVAYSPQVLEMRKELVERPALLIPRPFAFDDRPVTEVIQALEHAYGVPIVYDEEVLMGCTVRLLFKDEPMFEKLDLLCKALGATYERAGTKVIFHSKGCGNKLHPANTSSVEELVKKAPRHHLSPDSGLRRLLHSSLNSYPSNPTKPIPTS